MYIDSFNLCSKMIELIQYCFLFSPVELFQPMVTNCLHIFSLESVLKRAIFQVAAKTCFPKTPLEVLNICIRYLDSYGFYSDVIIFLFPWSPPLRLVVNRFQCRGHQEYIGDADGDQDGNDCYQFPTHRVVLWKLKQGEVSYQYPHRDAQRRTRDATKSPKGGGGGGDLGGGGGGKNYAFSPILTKIGVEIRHFPHFSKWRSICSNLRKVSNVSLTISNLINYFCSLHHVVW